MKGKWIKESCYLLNRSRIIVLSLINIGRKSMATAVSTPRSQSAASARDPFAILRKEMDDLISNFWGSGTTDLVKQTVTPAVDVVDSENALVVKMDAPGLEAKDIRVEVHGNTLTLSGERNEEKETKGKTFYRMERRHGSFSRTITLPCTVNENEAVADYTNGVLVLTLPKSENAKARKIPVKG
jgi:HSP20 family protein